MTDSKNTLNYFPRGTKKKVEESNYIFNTNEVSKKKGRDGSKFVINNKKKRPKHAEVDEFIRDSNIAAATMQEELVEEDLIVTNKIPTFNPVKGSLVMMAISRVHRDQYVLCNHTRNKKGYMSALDGSIIGKKVGQYMFAVVVGTRSKESNSKFVKRNKNLQLTDNLNIFNTFLTSERLQKGMQLQGIVESKEGKGYIIDLCLKDKSKAFLNFKEYQGPELEEGQQISVILKGKVSKSQKITKCIHQSIVENNEAWAIEYDAELNFECIKPGFLVEARIDSIVENGLNVTFGKGVHGVIFIDHLQDDITKYKKKRKVYARVISMDFEKKRVGLSQLENIVNLTTVVPTAKPGEILTNVNVIQRAFGKSYLVEGESIETGLKLN
jgi:exosome complex RNA-binding protein Csl4